MPDTVAWTQRGWGFRANSADELLRAITRIGSLQTGRRYVWRGVANAHWSLASSLVRKVRDCGQPVTEDAVRTWERSILREARAWGLGTHATGVLNDLALLTHLQHHHVPTRLLDVTSNPMTALWFACERHVADGKASRSGALFAIDVTDVESYPTIAANEMPTYADMGDETGWPLTRALDSSSAAGRPFLVVPSVPDSRMAAQEGLFLSAAVPVVSSDAPVEGLPLAMGDPPGAAKLAKLFDQQDRRAGRPAKLPFCVVTIPAKLKERIRPNLETTFNRTRKVLFPDLDGFSAAVADGSVPLPSQ